MNDPSPEIEVRAPAEDELNDVLDAINDAFEVWPLGQREAHA